MKLPDPKTLETIYGESVESGKRFERLTRHFEELFHQEAEEFFTSPGRTEIIGNHTDHNGGKILAASIDMDTIGAAAANQNGMITIISEGYVGMVEIDLADPTPLPKNQGTLSLVAGIIEGAQKAGFKVGGFHAYLSSNVIGAAGVSSSAAFEMLICTILNYFYNEGKMTCVDYAKIGQYAENHYWDKASGLMDQMACSVGGMISLDFSADVSYEKVDFTFSEMGYELVIVNTGKGHADLSNVYSEVPSEMRLVARELGKEQLSETTEEDFLNALPQIEAALSNDRALLRAFHFYEENKRVEQARQAIEAKDISSLLDLLEESGNSSWKWLQNCYPIHKVTEQKVSLTLALSEYFIGSLSEKASDSSESFASSDKSGCEIKRRKGCCRIHGGGFAGVILCVLPQEQVDAYVKFISHYVDPLQIYPIRIRKAGAIPINTKG
jgi:galactokinase